jgi:hypothetical protein
MMLFVSEMSFSCLEILDLGTFKLFALEVFIEADVSIEVGSLKNFDNFGGVKLTSSDVFRAAKSLG